MAVRKIQDGAKKVSFTAALWASSSWHISEIKLENIEALSPRVIFTSSPKNLEQN